MRTDMFGKAVRGPADYDDTVVYLFVTTDR